MIVIFYLPWIPLFVHELSIVLDIIEIAEEEVKKSGRTKVEMITLEIGTLTCIEETAFDFAWKEAILDTFLEKAELVKIFLAGKARCLNCNQEFNLEFLYDFCPACTSFRKEIIQGKELRIKSLIIF